MKERFDITKPLQAFDFQGEVAIITGGARGMGLAIAQTLAELGAIIVIADQDAKSVSAVAEDIDGEVFAVECDVTDEKSVENLVRLASKKYGAITVTGNQPLKTSTATTTKACLNPSTLKTLVPPAFPLPCLRISIPFVMRPIIILVGVEPII